MEENRKGLVFSNKKITSAEGKNLLNLRQKMGSDAFLQDFHEEPSNLRRSKILTAGVEQVQEKKSIRNKEKDATSSSGILDSIVEYGIYLLILAMPLFILPYSLEVYEFNKSFLLVFGAVILLFVWILDSVFVKKRILFSKSFITSSFFLFIVALFISSFASVDKASSIWGYGGNFFDSLVFYFNLFVFYIIFTSISAIKGSDRIVSKAIGVLIFSTLIVCLVSLPYYFGFSKLPFFGTATAGFNLISGYYRAFAIYILSVLFITLYDLSSFGRYGFMRKTLDLATAFLILVNLFLIDWPMIYLAIFVFCSVLALWGGTLKKNILTSKAEFMILAMIAFSSILFVSSLNLSEVMIGKVSLSNSSFISDLVKNQLNIKIDNINASVQTGFGTNEVLAIGRSSFMNYPITGSGLGTYYYDFYRYKSAGFNYDTNWMLGFSKAYNEMFERISTVGVLGAGAYLLMLIAAVLVLMENTRIRKYDELLFAAFLSLVLFQFMFFETSMTKFLFVLLLAIISSKKNPRDRQIEEMFLKNEPGWAVLAINHKKASGNIVSLAALAVILLCSVSMVLGIQIYRAEAKYKTAIDSKAPENLQSSESEDITKLNPYKGDYAAGVSRIYLSRMYKLTSTNQNDRETLTKIASEADSALSYAKKATEISPNNVFLWENYAFIYKSVDEVGMNGANDSAIKGYEAAINLSPNDPVIRTELSKIYLIQYQKDTDDSKKKEDLNKAKEQLEKAQELKNDYPDTALELALIYSYEGDKSKTLEQVDKASKMQGLSIQSVVEIGRLYYNLDEKNKAKNALNQVVAVDTNNADAHYILGTIYMEEKNFSQALNEFNVVAKYNPDNKGVTDIIKNLEVLSGGNKDDKQSDSQSQQERNNDQEEK